MTSLGTKRKETTSKLSLNIDGAICHDQNKISNHLCKYFATIADGIGNTDGITDSTFVTHTSVQSIMGNLVGHDSFQFQNLKGLEALQNLNPKKSTGWDGIPPKTFKLGARELSRPLTSL